MTTYLAIQNNYELIEVSLFKAHTMIDSTRIHKLHASKLIFTEIDALMRRNNLVLSDLSFCGVNQGPGPFTTLRVVIASMNGISFASGTPLIGVDGLNALLTQYQTPEFPFTVALLNAFNKDVYYAFKHNGSFKSGAGPIIQTLAYIKDTIPLTEKIRFIGNGTTLYQAEIRECVGSRTYIPPHIPETCSLEQIAHNALLIWEKDRQGVTSLAPLYLKQFVA